MIRVVLADDHTLLREGIRTLLGLVSDIQLVGEAEDGEGTVRVVLEALPDVLLLDMRMPHGDGRFVVTELARQGKLPPTLILTTFDDDEATLAVVRAGAKGFLLKDVKLERLVAAVRTLAGGGTMISPAMTERAQRELQSRAIATGTREVEGAEALSAREREVLRLLAAGYSNREIGKALFVAEGTVKKPRLEHPHQAWCAGPDARGAQGRRARLPLTAGARAKSRLASVAFPRRTSLLGARRKFGVR